jgi:hypothetical protein
MKEIITIENVRDYFHINYRHINLYAIMDRTIEDFLAQDYVKKLNMTQAMNYLYDYILSQDMCDVQE